MEKIDQSLKAIAEKLTKIENLSEKNQVEEVNTFVVSLDSKLSELKNSI